MSLICSSDESFSNSGSSSSSIVFQSLSQAPTDVTHSAKVLPATEIQPIKGICPTQETGQVVCPKTMRRIPKNYVPCVFLGQQDLVKTSKCPAKGWDDSLMLEEQSSKGSAELNNNSLVNGECQQWTDISTSKPSKEVFAQTGFSNLIVTAFSLCKNKIFFLGFERSHIVRVFSDNNESLAC